MSKVKVFAMFVICVFISTTLSPQVGAKTIKKPYLFGVLLVGPYNDHGWSQAHYEAGHYVEKNVHDTKMIYSTPT